MSSAAHLSDRNLIEIVRVLCVTAMMWVHVSPGLSEPSVVSTGQYSLVGAVFGDTLGRISVSLLSFISGFLMWTVARDRPLAQIVRRRTITILVPMLVWSAFYLLFAMAKTVALSQPVSVTGAIGTSPWAIFNSWSGLAGPTGNQSLFFLRDLFAVSVIVALSRPLIDRFPVAVALFAVVAGSHEVFSPVIFRASILQFFLLGVVAARFGLRVSDLSRPVVALPVGYVLAVASIVIVENSTQTDPLSAGYAYLVRRAGIGFLLLACAASVLAIMPTIRLPQLGRHAFLAYLMHVPFIGILWSIWRAFGGTAQEGTYLIFFLAAPGVTFLFAAVAGMALDRAPPTLQILLRGKSMHATRSNQRARLPQL